MPWFGLMETYVRPRVPPWRDGIDTRRSWLDDIKFMDIPDSPKQDIWKLIKPSELAEMVQQDLSKVLVIDSRSFLEYNTSHIQQSANVCCSKLVKRRLQQDKVHIKDLLTQTCHIEVEDYSDVIVYDQCTENPQVLTEDNFLIVLLRKLDTTFQNVTLLKGGFLAFQAMHPSLCESKTNNNYRFGTLTSLSQPCLPVSNIGPTRILPFLYLGSQRDALSQETIQVNGISYVLNVSTTCPKPPFIQEGHFHRIPVNDNYSEKMLPYFHEAFQFFDKVREANGCVLVHCLAGISRSPTLAIAFVMKYLNMSSDDAYRYVKDKRPTISPNFNFLGQLLEYEKQINKQACDSRDGKQTFGHQNEGHRRGPYLMDIQHCSPSSPVSKNSKPFFIENFGTKRTTSLTAAKSLVTMAADQEMTQSVSQTKSLTFSSTRLTSPVTKSEQSICSEVSKRPESLVSAPRNRSPKTSFSLSLSPAYNESPPLPCEPETAKAVSESHSSISKTHVSSSEPPVPIVAMETNSGHVTATQKVKLKSFSFSSASSSTSVVTQTLQSPSTAFAKLNFSQTNSETMETTHTIAVEKDALLQHFPTTSLDKLNFTPCFAKSDEGAVRPKVTATKRSICSSLAEPTELPSPASVSNSSSSGSTLTSPTTNTAKVILRSRENRAKRPLVRPNSIAFSTYPTFDLGSDCQDSPSSSSSASQDDSSEAYMLQNGKKSKHADTEGKFRLGRYSEREVYRQITAAMESAMIKTRVFEANRKSRSLDDILNSGDEDPSDLEDCSFGKVPRRCGVSADRFSPGLFENLPCRCRGSSDPYQSNSSISSSGSHSSLHGSMELIQVS